MVNDICFTEKQPAAKTTQYIKLKCVLVCLLCSEPCDEHDSCQWVSYRLLLLFQLQKQNSDPRCVHWDSYFTIPHWADFRSAIITVRQNS